MILSQMQVMQYHKKWIFLVVWFFFCQNEHIINHFSFSFLKHCVHDQSESRVDNIPVDFSNKTLQCSFYRVQFSTFQ
jgi:hypothetical protein